jgi:hypothetical protein
MRRLTLLLAVLLVPSFATAQGGPRYERPFLGGTITAPILAPTDCLTAVSYGFSGAGATAGLCRDSGGAIRIQSGIGASSALLGADASGVSAFYFNSSNQASGMQGLDGVTNFYAGNAIHAALTPGVFAVGIAASTDRLRLVPGAAGAGAFTGDYKSADLTGAREWSNPDVSGTTQINLVAGTAAPGATECDAANEVGRLYHQTGDPATVQSQLFRCTQTGPSSWAWMPAGYQSGTSAPATCSVGNVFFDTDATAGSNWFGCTSANTWSVQGGGLAAPGAAGVVVATGAGNTTVNRTITAAAGVTCSNGDGVAGNPTCGADRAVVPFKGSGTADPPATCGDTGDSYQIGDAYLETDTGEVSICIAIDVFALVSHITDDKVLVGTGTNAVVETLPACTDTGGNHLNYDTGGTPGSRFSCGTSGGGGGTDTLTTYEMVEDFEGGNSGSVGQIGTHGWSYDGYGGSSPSGQANGTADNPGVLNGFSSVDNAGFSLYLALGNTTRFTGSRDWSIEIVIIAGGVAGFGVTSVAYWFGLLDTGTIDTATSGIYAMFDTDRSHSVWTFAICDSGTSGCQSAGDDTNQDSVNSTIAPSNTNPNYIKIRRATVGVGGNPTYYFSVDGETEKTFCSSGCDEDLGNLPTGNLIPRIGFLTRVADRRDVDIDWARFRIPVTRY